MKYPKQYLDEIKTRLKVSTVVGNKVKLKKRGKEFVGLSPFSNEKTPSFTVNDQKGFYHCFSTTEHGNIFDFLMKTENLNFRETVNKLALQAGLPIYRFSKQDKELDMKWKVYKNILELYANFCHEELISGKFKIATDYLKERNLTKDEINFFKIGYVDIKNNFYEKIKSKFNNDEIISSGIFFLDEKNKKFIERFKGRIIFPIRDLNDSIIAFGGRSIGNYKSAKYINSPETLFFKKGNNLYNIANARRINNSAEEVFIVEGYIDVISLHKFGIKNVVANQGTALTEKQIDLVWRFFKNILICFDGDESGKSAALRTAERLFPILKPEFNIFFIFLPNNLDPDKFLNEKGKEAFIKLTDKKLPIYEFLWNYYFNIIDTQNPSSYASFEKKIKELCNQLKDKSLNKYFSEYFLKKLYDLTPTLNYRKSNFIKYNKLTRPLNETKKLNLEKNKYTKRKLKEYSLLYLIIKYPDFFYKKIELISETNFSDKNLNKLKSIIIDNLVSKDIMVDNFLSDLNKNLEIKNLIREINDVAPIKVIIKNKKNLELDSIFNEIFHEIKRIDLDEKIENLESKMTQQMDEKTFKEIIELKNLQKRS